MVTPNVILLGNKVFEDVNKELWGHDGLEWALNPMTDVYTRRSYENLKTEKMEKTLVMTKAQFKVTAPAIS